uniref:Uncharacterized protein n=1 Tax=Anguilla anguilla TaxID=7936 RepID=A0A0E9SBR3_ANGAN
MAAVHCSIPVTQQDWSEGGQLPTSLQTENAYTFSSITDRQSNVAF